MVHSTLFNLIQSSNGENSVLEIRQENFSTAYKTGNFGSNQNEWQTFSPRLEANVLRNS